MKGLIATLLIAALVVSFLYVVAQPTPQERQRMLDSTGRTTGMNWR